jgi:hypothetical protein
VQKNNKIFHHIIIFSKMLTKEVAWCSIDNWYNLFKKITFKTVILPIPNDVLEYLRSDGSLILPKECNKPDHQDDPDSDNEVEESNFPDDQDDDDDDSRGANETEQPTFPDFNAQVQAGIERLGGQVFCKLNWSAPRDASWVGVAHSLKCDSLDQIWLLLKSSEFIQHDLTQPFKDCCDVSDEEFKGTYVLVLKKWSGDLNPATEFRCFVKNRKLFAIEQRDASSYFSHIQVRCPFICHIFLFE